MRSSDPPAGNVIVDAYAGYKGEETPRAFIHDGIRRQVRDVLRRWYTDRHAYFRVRTDDQSCYVLRYELERDVWELVMQEVPQDPCGSG